MAGKMCPKCNELTLWTRGNELICSRCGYTVKIPPLQGKGGKGRKCPVCGKFTWFDGKCNSCGAYEK